MESYVDREFENVACFRQSVIRRKELFGKMLMYSLILHAAASIVFLSPGKYTATSDVVTFQLSDITLPTPSAPMTAPDKPSAEEPAIVQPAETPPPSESHQLSETMDKAIKQAETKPDVLQETSLGLGLSRGYFNSLAEGKSLRPDIREYYFEMLQKLNEAWWIHGGKKMNAARHEARLNLIIDRNGNLLRKELLHSSGDANLDKIILAVMDAASPFPPLPATYEGGTFSAPLKLAAPLALFSLTDNSL